MKRFHLSSLVAISLETYYFLKFFLKLGYVKKKKNKIKIKIKISGLFNFLFVAFFDLRHRDLSQLRNQKQNVWYSAKEIFVAVKCKKRPSKFTTF